MASLVVCFGGPVCAIRYVFRRTRTRTNDPSFLSALDILLPSLPFPFPRYVYPAYTFKCHGAAFLKSRAQLMYSGVRFLLPPDTADSSSSTCRILRSGRFHRIYPAGQRAHARTSGRLHVYVPQTPRLIILSFILFMTPLSPAKPRRVVAALHPWTAAMKRKSKWQQQAVAIVVARGEAGNPEVYMRVFSEAHPRAHTHNRGFLQRENRAGPGRSTRVFYASHFSFHGSHSEQITRWPSSPTTRGYGAGRARDWTLRGRKVTVLFRAVSFVTPGCIGRLAFPIYMNLGGVSSSRGGG